MTFRKLLSHALLFAVLTPPVFYLVTCLWVWRNQEELLLFPSRTLVQRPSLPFSEVAITSRDGVKLSGWAIPPEKQRAPWILHCHGNSGNVSHRVEIARLLHQAGFGVLLFDYRGFGRSEGRPHSEADLVADGQAFLDALKQQIPARRIVLFGESLGGGVACDLAAQQTVGGLILQSTFASLNERASETFPFLPVALLCRYPFNNVAALASIDCPKLIMHSPTDDVNGMQHGQELYRAARQPCMFAELKGSHSSPDPHSVARALETFRQQVASSDP